MFSKIKSLNRLASSNEGKWTDPYLILSMIALVLSVLSLGIGGCLKQTESTVVHASLAPLNEESEGVLYVVEGPVESAVYGHEDVTLKKRNVAGYLLIHPRDWGVMVRELRKMYIETGIVSPEVSGDRN